MKHWICVGIAVSGLAAGAWGQKPPLLGEKEVAAIAGEISGETAKKNLEGIAGFHRQRGSKGFHEAAELVAERLRAYGLNDVAILQFPADGKIFYGTQRSRPGWDAEVGSLIITEPQKVVSCNTRTLMVDCVTGPTTVLANYEAMPITLAEDSESGSNLATIVDVGEGTKESDYAGKDVQGKFVLVSAQPGAVQDLAVGKFGAVGIVSYAQNQKTAWWGEDENLIRWGHLETFSTNKTMAFMVSLKTARWLLQKESQAGVIGVIAEAKVKAGHHASNYEVVTATIPGADAKLKEEEIAFSCHLDHQRPGANDNASGCATILEVARTLQKLIAEGKLARPARTIRFIFPPEIEGTMALLTGHGYWGTQSTLTTPNGLKRGMAMDGEFLGPELAKRIKAVVHMDMVGGGPETKAVFHVTRGPMSLPSFAQDVAWAFAEWVNEESYQFAATGKAEYPLVSAEGGKEPLRAEYSAFTMGSDHDVYQDSSFGIPAIYLNDWPDRFIHTNLDSAANIDATKLKRAGFIGAASGYFLAGIKGDDLKAMDSEITIGRYLRGAALRERTRGLTAAEACAPKREEMAFEKKTYRSVQMFLEMDPVKPSVENLADDDCFPGEPFSEHTGPPPTYQRKTNPKGPLVVFGYDYFEVEWAKRGHTTKPKLLEYEGLWGGGEEYAYEALNFADGTRNALKIRDAVSAEYGPVPLELVVEYLKALEEIGVVEKTK